MSVKHHPDLPKARTAGPPAAPRRRSNSNGHTDAPRIHNARPAFSTRRQHLLSTGAVVAACPLGVEYRRIAELKLDESNPRLHSPKQVRQIARSIEAFGFNVPILIDRESKVVAGHGRVLACQLRGWTEVPVIRLDHLSPEQARAFQLADKLDRRHPLQTIRRIIVPPDWTGATLVKQMRADF